MVEMTQTASEQTSLKTGDRVMALVGGGGYAGTVGTGSLL